MIIQLNKDQRKHLLLDIDTQKDFFLPSGNACIEDYEKVLVNIRRMIAWARLDNVPIISTVEVFPNYNGYSNYRYCLDGTPGQEKISYTLLSNRITFPADNWNGLPIDVLLAHRQIILNKRCIDPFEEPRIDYFLSEVRVKEFVLIGAATEDSVEATAMGLLRRGKNVTVVIDAIGPHQRKMGNLALRKMQAKGVRLIYTKDIAGVSHLKFAGNCYNLGNSKERLAILKRRYAARTRLS